MLVNQFYFYFIHFLLQAILPFMVNLMRDTEHDMPYKEIFLDSFLQMCHTLFFHPLL